METEITETLQIVLRWMVCGHVDIIILIHSVHPTKLHRQVSSMDTTTHFSTLGANRRSSS